MPVIRTPEERFENLVGYPFPPNYIEVGRDDLRMHYVDEGWHDGEVILCLHGEPSWSYLYRHIIPPLAEDYRAVAPDLIGFGRSDKYSEESEYSFQMHAEAVNEFLLALDLHNITLVCQDWGGILGLYTAMQNAERFKRLIIMNTGLPTGDIDLGRGFKQWRSFVEQVGREMDISQIIAMGLSNTENLSPEAAVAYAAPFPDETYKAGAASFPLLVPVNADDPGAAEMRETREKLRDWNRPALVMFSDRDPISRGGDQFFRKLIPTAIEQPEITIEGAGHFLQEEKGPEIAQHILDFILRTP